MTGEPQRRVGDYLLGPELPAPASGWRRSCRDYDLQEQSLGGWHVRLAYLELREQRHPEAARLLRLGLREIGRPSTACSD